MKKLPKKKHIKQRKFTYISLFSGAGIGCFGFRQEDFECIATNEIIQKRLNIQRYNNICKFETGYIPDDLQKNIIKGKIHGEFTKWKEKESVEEVDVVIATPPCQGMSVANHKKKDERARNSLVVESIKYIIDINPRVFVLENVATFLKTWCTDMDGINKPIKEAIEVDLGGKYNILFEVINFKDYGNNSSRTRTLVLGTRKDLKEITPYDIFPEKREALTLRDVIGDSKPLTTMGEIDETDIFHSFRRYDHRMVAWIKDLPEGKSAFDNIDPDKKPHRMVHGVRIPNQNKNADKYRKCFWDKPAPCIHTRNDILASQATIHPRDDRVFSIRELMRMMTIPDDFRWLDEELRQLNSYGLAEKAQILFKEELNIRHCIGEAVPTTIFKQIANKVKRVLSYQYLNNSQVKDIIKDNNLESFGEIIRYVDKNPGNFPYSQLSRICEMANAKRQKHAAFYTSQDVCFSLIKELPEFKRLGCINIMEPSVGVGNFIPQLFNKYRNATKVVLDIVDIDPLSLRIFQHLLKYLEVPNNFTINFHNEDFLLMEPKRKYDIIIGNPPFGKLKSNTGLLKGYKANLVNKETSNIFSFFLEKSLQLGSIVALVSPKSVLSAPEFNKTRELLSKIQLITIIDYGEKGFRNVLIETIGIILSTHKKVTEDSKLKIESSITKSVNYTDQNYVCSKDYPTWIIYRNAHFDDVAGKLDLGIFNVFRDRQITKKLTKPQGKFRVLKSRNIGDNQIIDIDGYDSYIDSVGHLAVAKYLNRDGLVLVPNLSYYPRATYLPKNSITDGSVAILTPYNNHRISKEDLSYYSTQEFRRFYMLARNLGTRSLNVDRNSVYYYGKLNKEKQLRWL